MPIISGGGGGGAGGGAVQTVTVTLTDAQIKALPVTPAVLLAPPGAGKLIRFLGGWIAKDFTAGAYTNVGTTGMYFVYDTVIVFDAASLLAVDTITDSWMTGASIRQMDFGTRVLFVPGGELGSSTVSTIGSGADMTNTNLGFSIDNSGGAFTGGNAANTLTVTAYYALVTL